MSIVAGVDSSTQSTKVELRELESGRLVGSGRAPHPATTPPRSEQDPASWMVAFRSAWRDALDEAGVERVDAVSVAGQQHAMVVTDRHGVPLRPAKLWNDTESAPDAEWLISRLGPATWADACGSVPVAAFTISKLAWLRRHEPTTWTQIERVCLPHDWLTWQLTGRCVTDRGDASGTGYWSPVAGGYRWDLLELVDPDLDWPAVVPEVAGPIETVGDWDGAIVACGTGDNMAAALGVGLGPTDVAMSIGTSGTVYAVSNAATSDESGQVAGFADATGRFLPLVCTLNATKVTDAVARLLGVDHAGLDALAQAGGPDAGGLTLVPYLDGERTPNLPLASGVLGGIRSDVERGDLARAAFQGVVCGLLDALDALSALVATDGRLLLTGGGAVSGAFRDAVATLSGRPVTVVEVAEAVATGACVQAAAALSGEDPLAVRQRWSDLDVVHTIEPSGSAEVAAEIRHRYATQRDAVRRQFT